MIGVVAGLIVCLGVWFFDHVAHVDDPCGAISVHGVCGVWGVLAVGLFADGTYGEGWNGVSGRVTGLFYGAGGGQLIAQVFEVVVGFAWAFGITYLIFTIAKRFMKIRVSPEVELAGLDMAEFGGVCYPDFVLASNTPGHAAAYAGVHTLGDEEAPTTTREDGDRTETGSRA
jgi:Amt family ammonium transporter